MARPGRPNKVDDNILSVLRKIDKFNDNNIKKEILNIGINSTDDYKANSLILSCFKGNYNLAEWLIKNGIDINHQDRNGYSALHAAVQEKHTNIVNLLLKNNINIELKDVYGNTPLWVSVMKAHGNFELLNLLLKNNANPDNLNNNNKSPREMLTTIYGLQIVNNEINDK